jgi:hypothetical protein
MKKFIGVYRCNNGYTCHCHGRWWTEIEENDFDETATDDEIKAYFKSKEYKDEKIFDNIYEVAREII